MEPAVILPVQPERAASAVFAPQVFVDTHVHLYPSYDPARFFDAALRNVERAGGEVGVLCLTERPSERAFARLRESPSVGAWTFEDNGEGTTLLGERDGRTRLVVIAGRQVVTAERLEVLALGLDAAVEAGRPVEETVLRVIGAGALAVLPWGLGKWTGARRDAVARLIDRHAGSGLILGDNAGRPGFGPRPPLFDMAAAKRMTLLPGSDPLPIRMAQDHACTYGVILDDRFTEARVGRQVLDRLRDVGPVPHRFGERHGLLSFVRQQVALRLSR